MVVSSNYSLFLVAVLLFSFCISKTMQHDAPTLRKESRYNGDILSILATAEQARGKGKSGNRKEKPAHRVGTQANKTVSFNKEMKAIQFGIQDYQKRLPNRKPMLCVSFVKGSEKPLELLRKNMNMMGRNCEWAVIFYDESTHSVDDFCDFSPITEDATQNTNTNVNNINMIAGATAKGNVTLVHCKRAAETLNRPTTFIPTQDGKIIQQSVSVPKTVLYRELLPLLPQYETVFMLDEDISLEGFNIKSFMNVWNCAFGSNPRPLIAQPLIVEKTQYFPFVHLETWQKVNRTIYASGVGLVEQQVPFFDALFFEWFVRRVLSQTRDLALRQGVDQSHDRTWCRAAAMYSSYVLNVNYTRSRGQPCALIIGGEAPTAVHHLNTRSLQNKKANRSLYREKAHAVNQLYRNLFPSWCLEDIRRAINPLDKTHGRKYKKYTSLNPQCVAKQ